MIDSVLHSDVMTRAISRALLAWRMRPNTGDAMRTDRMTRT
jgi:hypothetical protein